MNMFSLKRLAVVAVAVALTAAAVWLAWPPAGRQGGRPTEERAAAGAHTTDSPDAHEHGRGHPDPRHERADPEAPDLQLDEIRDDVTGVDLSLLEDLLAYRKLQEKGAQRYVRLKGKPGVVWGRVLLPKGRANVPRQLRLRSSGRPGGPDLVADEHGRFAFEPVEPGKYDLVLYETSESPGIRYEGLAVEPDEPVGEVVLTVGNSSVEVIVADEFGKGLGGVRVTVGKSAGGGGSNPKLFTYRRGITDAAGRFVAEGLTDGGYTVIAEFGSESAAKILDLGPDQRKTVKLVLRLSGRQVRGFVRDMTNRGLSRIPVTIAGPSLYKTAETTNTGEFVINAVPAGQYMLTAGGNRDYLPAGLRVKVTDGPAVPARITLRLHPRAAAGTIRGAVRLPPGLGPADVFVTLVGADGLDVAVARVRPEDGSFALSLCPPGTYAAVLWAWGGADNRRKQLARQDGVLVQPGGIIEGIVLGQ